MSRARNILLLHIFVIAALGLTAGIIVLDPGPLPRPDIVLIIIDTERQDALSCYGNPRETTPGIDAIAAEGRLFENATSPSPWTAPAVGSILTGKLPSEHRFHLESTSLRSEETTFVELLAGAGYQTVGYSNNPWIDSQWNVTQGFEEFHEIWRERQADEASFSDEGSTVVAARFSEFLDRRDPERRFFALLHFIEPHFPYSPPPPFDARFSGGQDPETVKRVRGWETPFELGFILGENQVSDDEFAALRAQYDAEGAYVDRVIGGIAEDLRRRGLYDELLLIITSDHGENIGEHGLMDHKFCVYNTLLRVPLIVRYPPALPLEDRVDAPDRPAHPVQTSDIFHTIVEAARVGDGVPPEVAGSAAGGGSLLDDGPMDRPVRAQHFRPILFLEAATDAFPTAPIGMFLRRLSSVEQDGWKLIHSSDGKHELYHVAEDPGETRNLFGTEPEREAALERLVAPID